MQYVNCPRCRIAIRLRVDALVPEHCPRCEKRHGVREPLFVSNSPSRLVEMASQVGATHGGGPAAPVT